MIKQLTVIYHTKKSVSFETHPIIVNMNLVTRMYPNKLTLSAPTVVDSLVYRDGVPDDRYKEITSVECTTLCFVDGSTIDVKEKMEEIMKPTIDYERTI